MKVLLLHDYGTATGGAELQMLALRQGLRDRGHDVRLFTSRASYVPADVLADDDCFGLTNTRLQVFTQTVNPSAVVNLRRVLRSFAPDVVHARMIMYQLSPAILPLLRDTPAIYQEATYKSVCLTGTRVLPDGSACRHIAGRVCLRERCVTPQSWAVLRLQHALWQRWRGVFSRFVALSHAMKTELELGGLSPVHVMHNGVSERRMRPPLAGPPRLVYAGRLSPEKGVDRLLRVFARVRAAVPDAVLDILGDGPLRASLETLSGSLGVSDSVQFHGHLMRDAMEAVCDRAWVQAVPSQWAEPFGNVSTEAMMRGTAVVASCVGGQQDIVHHEVTGFLLPPRDDDAWVGSLAALLADRSLAEACGAAGRARALALFSESASLDRWEAMYHEVISEHASRHRAATTHSS